MTDASEQPPPEPYLHISETPPPYLLIPDQEPPYLLLPDDPVPCDDSPPSTAAVAPVDESAPTLSTLAPSGAPPAHSTLRLVPPRDAFQAAKASELLEALWSLGLPTILSLTATSLAFELGVTCPTRNLLTYQSTLYGVLPALEIVTRPATAARSRLPTLVSVSGERHEDNEALPMQTVTHQKAHDSLNRIIEACYPLAEDETVDIHFFLTPADQARLDRTYRTTYTESGWWIFKSVTPKFHPRAYPEVRERMRQFAFDVVSVIALSGRDDDRLTQRAHALTAAFASRTTNTGSEIKPLAWGITHDTWERHASFSLNDLDYAHQRYGAVMTVEELATLWHIPSEQVLLPQVPFQKLPSVSLPPAMLAATGIPLGTHPYRGVAQPVHLPLANLKAGPVVILGRTGQGKTTIGHHLVAHAARLEPTLSLAILDPHGDWVKAFATQSVTEEQLARTYLIDFADTDVPIGFPFFRKPDGLSQDAFVADTFETIKLLFKDTWSSTRMARVIRNTVPVLCRLPDATLMDFARLYTELSFRQRSLAAIHDPAVLDFFRAYDSQSEAAQREMVAPVLNRISALYESAPMRNITCRADGLDIPQLLNEGARLLFSFIGPEIAAEADTLMELVVARIHLAMQARAALPEHERRPTLMAIDESQRIQGNTLPALLSQDRKFGLIPVLLTQFVANWATEVEQATIGNTASLVAFSLGPDDARKLAPLLAPYTPQHIMALDPYQAFVRLTVGNQSMPAFHLRTQPVTSPSHPERLVIARENARRRFGKPRAEVERRFQTATGRSRSAAAAWDDFDVSPLT